MGVRAAVSVAHQEKSVCLSKLTRVSDWQPLCARALWSGSFGLQIITSSLVLQRSTCAGLSVIEAVWVRAAWSPVFTFLGLSRFYSAWTKFQLPFLMMKQAVMGVLDVEALKISSSSPLNWESPSFWILYQNSASVFLPNTEQERVGCGKTKSEVTFMGLFVPGIVHMPVIPREAEGGGVWVWLVRPCLEQPGFGM